ncbi:MAG: hypothetical protein AAF411_04060 [Myxococcota bacterium]
MKWALFVAALSVPFLTSLGCITPTQTVVWIDLDETLQANGTFLEVDVRGGDANTVRRILIADTVFPVPKYLHPRNDDAARRFGLVVRVLDAEREELVEREVVAGFRANRLSEVRVMLSAECEGVRCSPGQSCVEGGCEPFCYEAVAQAGLSAPVACTGSCDGQGDLSPCSEGGEVGTCRQGACCLGCWDLVTGACLGGNDDAACGSGGEDCTPVCAGESCAPGSAFNDGVVNVVVEEGQSCARTRGSRAGDRMWCWGVFADGSVGAELNPGAPGEPDRFLSDVPLVLGAEANLAVNQRGHCIASFGGGTRCEVSGGPLGSVDGPDGTFRQIVAGRSHACARTAIVDEGGGEVTCWGAEDRVGRDGALEGDPRPIEGVNEGWEALDAAHSITCGLRGGRVFCWGRLSQTGLANDAGAPTPIATPPGEGELAFVQLEAAQSGVCAIDTRGRLYCNGRRAQQLLALPNAPSAFTWIDDGPFQSVSVGRTATCVIAAPESTQENGRLLCRGSGLLGSSDDAFVALASSHRWKAVAVGNDHACATRDDDTVWCFGASSFGQLGLGATSDVLVPQRVCLDLELE